MNKARRPKMNEPQQLPLTHQLQKKKTRTRAQLFGLSLAMTHYNGQSNKIE
jgi:hypothetical protein